MQQNIETILKTNETGARVEKINANTYKVYHCPRWNSSMEYELIEKIPNLKVYVTESEKSLSKFEILLVKPVIYVQVTLACIVGLLMGVFLMLYKDMFVVFV